MNLMSISVFFFKNIFFSEKMCPDCFLEQVVDVLRDGLVVPKLGNSGTFSPPQILLPVFKPSFIGTDAKALNLSTIQIYEQTLACCFVF